MRVRMVKMNEAHFTTEGIAHLDWSSLPRWFRDLRKVVGEHGALAMSRSFGGASIYIPMRPHRRHPVARCIGMELARRLGAEYGGDCVSIPKPDAVMRQVRSRRICSRRDQGATFDDLALEFKLSRRRVLQILNVQRELPRARGALACYSSFPILKPLPTNSPEVW